MLKVQKQVEEFHRKFELTINKTPTLPHVEDRRLRFRLINEELQELRRARTLVDVADALGDLLYVVLGAAVTYGMDLQTVFEEIHRSNMSKLWEGGKVVKDAHGKVMKPLTYSPADLLTVLRKQCESTVDHPALETEFLPERASYGSVREAVYSVGEGQRGFTVEDVLGAMLRPELTSRASVRGVLIYMLRKKQLVLLRRARRGRTPVLALYRLQGSR